jgi:hypothetical protein
MTLPTTPSLEAARQEIAGRIKAAQDASLAALGYVFALEAPNRTQIDVTSAEAERAFLAWEIVFRPGYQASLGPNPVARQLGQIALACKIKLGSGSEGLTKLADHVIPYIERKRLAVVEIEVASVADFVESRGFYCLPILANFWIDRLS